MKFLAAALALLLAGFASATIQLSYPEFIRHKTHIYDVWINVTSGVPGMHSQVAKSAMNMECKIYAATKHDVYISIGKVWVSKSVASVGSKTEPVKMEASRELEEHLKVPIKVSFENGKVKSYTLDNQESLESKKIKKTILRHFEVVLDNAVLTSPPQSNHWPLTYNLTKTSPVGNYSSHYTITSSPYADFPKDKNVINITRTDNYEGIPYLAYHSHHNFEEQGCPGVCKKDQVENRFSAGCPAEWEPYQTPMKKSFVQHHNLRRVKNEDINIIDIIKTKETHVADVYDQNMEVAIESLIRYQNTSATPIPEPTGQTTYTDLNEWKEEVNDKAINRHCKYTTPEQALTKVKELLNHITKIVYEGRIEGEGKNIGEEVVLLQRALTLLKREDLAKIQEDIPSHEDISHATEEQKIKRQIWLDNLPLIGTDEAISFLVDLIKKSINDKHHEIISLWESKDILEALPMNIFRPNGKTIEQLSELLEELKDRKTPGYGMYYSAAHMAVARVIRSLCAVSNGIPEMEESKPNYLQQLLRETNDDYKYSKCPKAEAKKFTKNLIEKLKRNKDRLQVIIGFEALSQTGLRAGIPILKSCVDGHISGHTPSYRDYIRSVCIYALHNLAIKHPKQVKDIVLPVYFNQTEPPKIRTAAFSVLVKSYPTLGDLQHVAEQTWHEPSEEVGSFVTSAMETLGNSTIPCDQLTAHRIKKVISQVKRFDIGKHHAQKLHRTIFDEVRGFGLDHRFEFTPSNESFIPSAIYASLGYNADSLRDGFFKYAINSQGFNSFNLWDNILEALKLKIADDIPKSKEPEIFPKVKIAARGNEFWRFTAFEKLFYSMSYYYMDEDEYQNGDILSLLERHIKNYFTVERNGTIHGHLVKLWLPSSYHSKAFAQTLPYPVQFEIRNPMILSMKINIKPKENGIAVDVHPSYYQSMLYSNEMLNLGDCKQVGVYHEKKIAVTYPFKFTFEVEKERTAFSYSFPEFERQQKRKIVNYYSEAGTYAKTYALEVQPSSTERRTIKTIPSQYVRNHTFGVVGLPLFESHLLTEDISLGYEEIPRNHQEAVHEFIKDYMNAGWRRKHIEIYRKVDSRMWGPKTEVKMYINHQHSFVKAKEPVESHDNWVRAVNLEKHDEKNYSEEEDVVYDRVKRVTHLQDILSVSVEHKVDDQISNKAHFRVDHNRTLEGDLHTFKVSCNAEVSRRFYGVVFKGAALYLSKPNEFNYGDDSYGKQKGVMIASVWFAHQEKPYIAAKVLLSHKSLEQYLNLELQTPLPSKYFYPETHERCIRDKQAGNSLSVDCWKAIGEYARYNNMKAKIVWSQDLPPVVEEIGRKLEIAVMHTLFKHLSIEKKNSAKRSLYIDVTHINKLTDKPVVDIVVTKPTEVLRFNKTDPSFIQPVSSIYNVPDTYIRYYTNNSYPATCTLSEKYVTTYDLKEIRLPKDKSCSYILTSHCVWHKKFAVIVKIDSQRQDQREIHLYVGKHSIVLTPARQSKYEIKYDNRSLTVKYHYPIMVDEAQKIYAVVNRHASNDYYIEIHAEKAGITVIYDGKHVKTQVHPRYKGELCGLCSEFNGERVKEMRGPSRCLYSHADDYASSCAVGSCYKPEATHKSICSNDDYEHAEIDDEDEIDENSRAKEYAPMLMRNKVLPKDDKVCFSKIALPVCRSQDVAKHTETKEVEFHCLPAKDSGARKLVRDSKRRILLEIETKQTDRKENVEYPTTCVDL